MEQQPSGWDPPFGTRIVENALAGFAVELGARLRAAREHVGMPVAMLSTVLTMAGVPMAEGEVEQLEAGSYPNLDARLLIALAFTMDIAVDDLIASSLRRAAGARRRQPPPAA